MFILRSFFCSIFLGRLRRREKTVRPCFMEPSAPQAGHLSFPAESGDPAPVLFSFVLPRSLRSAVCSQRVVATRSDPGREHLHTAAPYHVLTSGSQVVHA